MKIYFKAICVIFLIASCGTSKKTKTFKSVEITSKESNVSTKDSITNIKEVEIIKKDSIVLIEKIQPTESVVVLDLDELGGDFSQTTSSGDGTGTTIKKVGNQLIVTTTTAGSTNKETTVDKSEAKEKETDTKIKKTNDHEKTDSETTIDESSTVIVRTPWWMKFWIWLLVIIGLIVVFRKRIFGWLSTFFPVLKIFKL